MEIKKIVRDNMPSDIREMYDLLREDAQTLSKANVRGEERFSDELVDKISSMAILKVFLTGYKNELLFSYKSIKEANDEAETEAYRKSRKEQSIKDSEIEAKQSVKRTRKSELELDMSYRYLRDFLDDIGQMIMVAQTKIKNLENQRREG